LTRLVLACGSDRIDVLRADAVAKELAATVDGLEVALLPRGGGPERTHVVESARDAVRSGDAHAAVHAWVDVPFGPPERLVVAAVPSRADPRDCLITRTQRVTAYLPPATRVVVSEPRQAAQILRRRSDLDVAIVLGGTLQAMQRFDEGDGEGIVVTVADLDSLGWTDRVTEFFDTDQMIPAPGQGALAIEALEGDELTVARLQSVHDRDTAYAVLAERTCAKRLGASGQSPVGIFAVADSETMVIHGVVATPDGSRAARLRWSGPSRSAEEVGATLAELLDSVGAGAILAGGELPPSIRYADRRNRLIEEMEEDSEADYASAP
jgi:hydroxymethylbilane synthase